MRSFIKGGLILILLLLTFHDSDGQNNILMLQKKNKNKNVYYKVGDDLIFYRNGESSRIKGNILAIDDSILVFRGYKVHIKEITALHIDEKTRWWLRFKAAQLPLICGSGYLVLDVANSGEVSEKTLVISGTMIGLGIVFKLLIPNKIKIKGMTKLKILKL